MGVRGCWHALEGLGGNVYEQLQVLSGLKVITIDGVPALEVSDPNLEAFCNPCQ